MKELLEVSKPNPFMMIVTLAVVAPFVIAQGDFFTRTGMVTWMIAAVIGAVFLQVSFWGLARLVLWLGGFK